MVKRASSSISLLEGKIFLDVGFAIEGRGSTIERIQISGIRKEDKEKYMQKFVDYGWCKLNPNNAYTMTDLGHGIFQRLQGKAERTLVTYSRQVF